MTTPHPLTDAENIAFERIARWFAMYDAQQDAEQAETAELEQVARS